MEEKNSYIRQVADKKYEYGFTTDIHTDIIETFAEIEVKAKL